MRSADSGPEDSTGSPDPPPIAGTRPPPTAESASSRAPRRPRARLWDLAAAGALYTGLLFLFFGLADPEIVSRAESSPTTFLWLQLLDDGLLTGVALVFGLLRFPGSWEALGFRAVRPAWCAIGVLGGVAAAALAWTMASGLEWAGWPAPVHPVEAILAAAESRQDLFVILLAVTVPVAIGEEVFFRGFAYRLLRSRFGVVRALGATAVLFALVHGVEVSAWLPVLPVGIVLGVLVERSGSLVPALVAHAAVNALAVVLG